MRYEMNGLSVAVGSGLDAYYRADPWETEWSPNRRPSWSWYFAAKYLNGLPTYETSNVSEYLSKVREER